jgi:hypothetical protein
LPDLPTGRAGRDLRRPLRLRERQSCFEEERATRVRQRHSALRPIEEADAEVTLETANLLTEWWLRDVQAFRGATEMQLFRDGHEVAEVT